MKKSVYSLYDHKVKYFMTPIFLRNDAEATRVLIATVSQNKDIANFAKDYTLFQIAEFDEENGLLKKLEIKRQVLSAEDARHIFEKEMKDLEGFKSQQNVKEEQ